MSLRHLIGLTIAITILTVISTDAQRRVELRPGDGGTGRQKWAVIIGVDRFDDPNISALRFTVQDAQKLYTALTTTAHGFPRENVILMTPQAKDSNHQPKRNNIIAMLTSWLALAEEGDTVLVYFSGHGVEVDGESYLVPSDTKLSNPALTAINLNDVKNLMRRSKARQRILILDACHSGEGKATPRMGQALNRSLSDAEGMVTLASCGLNESSYEMQEQSQGAFTYYLVQALEGVGDLDRDGMVSAYEAYRHTYEATSRWAASQGLSQRPKWVAAVQGEMFLVGNLIPVPVTPPGMVRIPAGEFQMGTPTSQVDELYRWSKQLYSGYKREWIEAETPQHPHS